MEASLQANRDFDSGSMTFYRVGQRLRMTRAAARRMARTGSSRRAAEAFESAVQAGKQRFGGAVRIVVGVLVNRGLKRLTCLWFWASNAQIGRPLSAALASALDSGLVFHSAEYLFFDDGEDDDGTYVALDGCCCPAAGWGRGRGRSCVGAAASAPPQRRRALRARGYCMDADD